MNLSWRAWGIICAAMAANLCFSYGAGAVAHSRNGLPTLAIFSLAFGGISLLIVMLAAVFTERP